MKLSNSHNYSSPPAKKVGIANQHEIKNQKLELSKINHPEGNFEFDDLLNPKHSNLKITPQQAFNEDIIKLAVLLYQIDGKVTLTEQDYFDQIISQLEWQSGVSLPAFVNDAIHQARVAIDTETSREYLFSLSNGLNVDPASAFEIAMDITQVDGARCEEELELLALLSNRVLAKGLVA